MLKMLTIRMLSLNLFVRTADSVYMAVAAV